MISAVKGVELPATPSFFEIVKHCQKLDEHYSNILGKRHTRIYIIDDPRKLRACIRVSHVENGGVWGQCTDVFEEDDIITEIDSLHRVISDRINCSKVIGDEHGELPF